MILSEYFPVLEQSFLGNTYERYLISTLIFILLMIALKVFKSVILKKIRKFAEKTINDFDDFLIKVISEIKGISYIICTLYISALFLNINDKIRIFLFPIFLIVIISQIVVMAQKFIDYGVRKFLEKNGDENSVEKRNKEAVIRIISNLAKWSLWVIALILVLSNLGINVTSLITGLGIGGIAIALAVQNILSDIFSSLSIFIDKPFQVGDFITTGKESGTVKKIGIKTTRIVTLDGDELVIPNKDLTESRVHNFKKLKRRRSSIEIGVVYGTPLKKLKKIPKMLKNIINDIDLLEADRVTFKEFGDFSLIYEAVFYTDSEDYGVYMEKKQDINFQILEDFEKEKIEFAYPTQNIILNK